MTIIKLDAKDQLLTAVQKPKIASGDIKSVTLHVDFSSEWDGYAKSAVFFTSINKKTVFEMILTDDECIIPHEVLAQSCVLFVGVRGVNADNGAVKTSALVKYKVDYGAPAGDGTSVDPTADVYQQLLTACDRKEEKANKVTTITANSTDRQYPSAKATFDLVTALVSGGSGSNGKTIESKEIKYLSPSGAYLGDVNGDGELSNEDSIALLRYIQGLSSSISDAADINGDGVVNDEDSAILSSFLASETDKEKQMIVRITEKYTDGTSYTYYGYADKPFTSIQGALGYVPAKQEDVNNLADQIAALANSGIIVVQDGDTLTITNSGIIVAQDGDTLTIREMEVE